MVTLQTALVNESPLRDLVETGLAALLRRDRSLIAETERPRVGDSLDIDTAFRVAFPQANRWDYLLSVPSASKLIALEPHTARDSEVSVVIAKKQHAQIQLRSHLKQGHTISEWLWVSRGPSSFSKMDRASKRLDQAGIRYVGRSLQSLG